MMPPCLSENYGRAAICEASGDGVRSAGYVTKYVGTFDDPMTAFNHMNGHVIFIYIISEV
jgi:hypothetical protein